MRPSKTSRLRLAEIASLLLRCNQVYQAADMSSKMSTNTPLQVFPYFFFRHSLPVPSCQLQAPKASNSHVQCMSKLSADKITVIVDGYSTMPREIEEQLEGQIATHVFAPVGLGSFAQALTTHFRSKDSSTSVIGVEPDVAACLWKSLKATSHCNQRRTHDHGRPRLRHRLLNRLANPQQGFSRQLDSL
jgi:hypothetical protein